MPASLPVGVKHSYDDLAFYSVVEDKLVDAYSVEYVVYDDSVAYPGVQILPVGGRQVVTSGAGHFAVGSYGVYDAVAANAWAPSGTLTRGRVVWYVTMAVGGAERVVERPFEVVAVSLTVRSARHICLVQDIKDAGAPASYTDLSIFRFIDLWTARIERYCRQRFTLTRETVRIHWRDDTAIILNRQLFAFGSLLEDGSVVDFDSKSLYAFNERGNPRIEIKDARASFGGKETTVARLTGIWGCVDGTTQDVPIDIALSVSAALVRVMKTKEQMVLGAISPIRREKTDGHEVEYATALGAIRTGLDTYLKSAEIRDLLDMYRAPIGIAMTG